jgi:hypothetical protein
MYKQMILVILASFLFTGCATVPMESKENSNYAKEFNPPADGKSGLYVYRSFGPGTALKKDILVDDECLGESAQNVFFYKEVKADEEHKISTESEFSPNVLLIPVKSGINYFIKQYIKMGVFVGGANLEIVDAEKGKEDVSKLELAKIGTCSK